MERIGIAAGGWGSCRASVGEGDRWLGFLVFFFFFFFGQRVTSLLKHNIIT